MADLVEHEHASMTQFRREARRKQKEKGISYSDAIEALADDQAFLDFNEAQKVLRGEKPDPRPKRNDQSRITYRR